MVPLKKSLLYEYKFLQTIMDINTLLPNSWIITKGNIMWKKDASIHFLELFSSINMEAPTWKPDPVWKFKIYLR